MGRAPTNMLYLVLFVVSTAGLADPPAVQVTVAPAETVRPGSQIEIRYGFFGTASEDDRLWLPPAWPETEGLEFLGWEQHITATPASRVITWIARVRVLNSGVLTIPPLAFRSFAEADLPAGEVSLAREPTLTVTAPEVTIYGWTAWKVLIPAGLAAMIGFPAAGAAGYVVYRRRTRSQREEKNGFSSIRNRWHRARRLRLDGDDYGALKELLALCGEAGGPRELIDELDTAARDAGFRNRVPDPDTFEGLFRRVEKVVNEHTAGADRAPQPTGIPE